MRNQEIFEADESNIFSQCASPNYTQSRLGHILSLEEKSEQSRTQIHESKFANFDKEVRERLEKKYREYKGIYEAVDRITSINTQSSPSERISRAEDHALGVSPVVLNKAY